VETKEEVKEVNVEKLMRGERPETMSYEDFKIKRRAVQKVINLKLKGRYLK
jgi:hypothetical protein